MQGHTKFAVFILVLGFILIVAWRQIKPEWEESRQTAVSDAGEKGTISLAVDGWIGYFPLCSPEMRRRLNREGYGLRCVDDAANYDERFKKLKNNEYQFAVATVDSYLLNAEKYAYPGPIISVLDESKGGDAIVAYKDSVANLEALKKAQDLKVALTFDSPSHHLLKAVTAHFDIALFKQRKNLVPSDGSEDALKKLKAKQVDIAILWEPDLSQALKDESVIRILGTEDTKQLIVDILIASQATVKDKPELILSFLKSFYQTQRHYRNNPESFIDDISDHYDINKNTSKQLLEGVHWATLFDNAERWFGVSETGFSVEALIQSIEASVDILLEYKDFSRNPLPNHDPYALTNSSFIRELHKAYSSAGGFGGLDEASEQSIQFAELSEAQWDQLKEVAALKARKIQFASGSADLTEQGQATVKEIVQDLRHYPKFRIDIRGHSGIRGEPEANLALSQERAQSVLSYIRKLEQNLDNRVRAKGYGSTRPLERLPGESSRAYNYRLPRVEIVLVREHI